MDPGEFRRILHNGLGRAILYLHNHDAAPHREAIHFACLHNTVFDRQINGSNAEYIYEAIELSGEAEFYRNALLIGLREPTEEYHLGQICDLLKCFAQHGDQGARQALYDAFDRDEAAYEAMFAVVELDGLPGFIHVAEGVGPSAEHDADFWEGEYFLGKLEERYGNEATRVAVAAAAGESPRIAAYLAAIERKSPRPRRIRFDPETMGYDDLKAIVAHQGALSPMSLRKWGVWASEVDIDRLAADVLTETDPDRLHTYLRVFAERPFPPGHAPLFLFVDSPHHRVVHAAIAALSVFRHPEVRALALRLLTTRRAWAAMDLLIGNYDEGDHRLIETALTQPAERDDAEQHWFEIGVRQIFERFPSAAATQSLIHIYEHGRCFLCRYGTVKLLHGLGTLPETIRHECEYDADFDLRVAARRHFHDEDAASDS
jgi:hypothetical protein